jgi:hypothetical protein
MLLIIGGFIAVCVLSSYLTTTPEQRAEARARFNRRWNPVLIPLNIVLLGLILWAFVFPASD